MNDASIDPSGVARISLSGEGEAQTLELAGQWTTSRITRKSTLASFKKLFRPLVINALRNAFPAA